MKIYATIVIILAVLIAGGEVAHAQAAPTLYNQSGTEVNAFDVQSNSLAPGWYYSVSGAPLYYYANGAYYDPSTQSYGGSVLYPSADGPSLSSEALTLTPGVPNTGVGGRPFTMLLALLVSACGAVAGTYILGRHHLI